MLVGWVVTILIFQTIAMAESATKRKIAKKLEAEPFESFLVYHSITPVPLRVAYGAEARYTSDSEVKRAGFYVNWDEIIQCDHNPYDNIPIFEYYAEARSTGRTYANTRPRKTPEALAAGSGFPVLDKQTGLAIRYPDHDSNCRLVSAMTIKLDKDVTKTTEFVSDYVEVRDI